MKTAFVTLIIGAEFISRWERNSKSSWVHYCQKHGYDLICLTELIDASARGRDRSPAWQKCLTLGHEQIKNYDRVIWVDSDIIINKDAPCILAQSVPEAKIGAVDNFGKHKNGADIAIDYYKNARLPARFETLINTGVLIMAPVHHRSLLEHVYFNYDEHPGTLYEQLPLSYEILKNDLGYFINPDFNCFVCDVIAAHYPFLVASTPTTSLFVKIKKKLIRTLFCRLCLEAALRHTYFLHFAGYGLFLDERNPWGRLE
jgi:hypothetical protein